MDLDQALFLGLDGDECDTLVDFEGCGWFFRQGPYTLVLVAPDGHTASVESFHGFHALRREERSSKVRFLIRLAYTYIGVTP